MYVHRSDERSLSDPMQEAKVKGFRLAGIEICNKRVSSVPNKTTSSHSSCCLVASGRCLPIAADEGGIPLNSLTTQWL